MFSNDELLFNVNDVLNFRHDNPLHIFSPGSAARKPGAMHLQDSLLSKPRGNDLHVALPSPEKSETIVSDDTQSPTALDMKPRTALSTRQGLSANHDVHQPHRRTHHSRIKKALYITVSARSGPCSVGNELRLGRQKMTSTTICLKVILRLTMWAWW